MSVADDVVAARLFEGIWGVGPATARELADKGLRTIEVDPLPYPHALTSLSLHLYPSLLDPTTTLPTPLPHLSQPYHLTHTPTTLPAPLLYPLTQPSQDVRKHRELLSPRQLVGLDLYEQLQTRIPRGEVSHSLGIFPNSQFVRTQLEWPIIHWKETPRYGDKGAWAGSSDDVM